MAYRRPRLRFAALVVLIGGPAAAVYGTGLPSPEALSAAAATPGPGVAALLAVAAAALLSVALVPRTVLAAASGVLFGPVAGAAYVLAGAVIGAVGAFAAGRWLGRDLIATSRRAVAVDRWLTARGTLGVLTVRLLPVAPFGLASYLFGTTGIALRRYLAGTALGIVPSTAVYAHLGAHAMTPGTAGFAWSVAAAAALAAAGAGTAAALARARARRARALGRARSGQART
ncbi:MAG TPA: VTT domain-containing protein [Micromonosporaceae bacterium]|nr:VTT domain-containing protein [Micromonosporaceae bacterium]